MQNNFYNTLPKLPECGKSKSDLALFLYDLKPDQKSKTLILTLDRVVFTTFADALKQIAKFEAGPISTFTKLLQAKLDSKLSYNSNADNGESIVTE